MNNRKMLILVAIVLIVGAKFAIDLFDAPDDASAPAAGGAAPSAGSTRTNAAPVEQDPRRSNALDAADSVAPARGDPRADRASEDGLTHVVQNAVVLNYGKVHYRGPIDLSATIERIRAGESHSHRNDGSVFGNREKLLPRRERGYYREYVHPTRGISGPGPQRVVVGRDGDWWYTPDHYESFVSLGTENR